MTEFELISRHFTRPTPGAELGVGDDAALLHIPPGMELAASTDMLVEGTHFFHDADPFKLGIKTLAVNLSDLAAMGAQPRWVLLALSLPVQNDGWLQAFSSGFFNLAEQFGIELIGGDTTRGPLNLSVTALGLAPQGQALRRSGACPHDDIWVSGTLGDAAIALAHLRGELQLPPTALESCTVRLHQPQPRVALGLALRGIAHSAIDISDGLLADLGHILESSNVSAEIRLDAIPLSQHMGNILASSGEQGRLARRCILSGGDDYELCFTAAPEKRKDIEHLATMLEMPIHRIGKITPATDGQKNGCTVLNLDNTPLILNNKGYDHFA